MHDECEHIDKDEHEYNLLNNESLRAYHCHCEFEFYDCLHRINSTLSNHIGDLYFTLHTRCYQNDYQMLTCREWDIRDCDEENKRCTQYLLMLTTPITTQWFDLPHYFGKKMKKPLYIV